MSPGGGAQASGSPQAAGGAEGMLAQILMQLQQNQAEIARDTRQGLQTLSDSLKAVLKKPGTVDVKGVGKPSELKGSHDEVAKAWKSWSYKFETWFCSQWPAGQQALDWARLKGDDPVTAHDLLNSQLEDIDPIDAHLHVALVSLTQGMAYDVVYNSRKKCGLDAWRRLCFTYEPHNNRTNIRLLRRILNPPRSTMSTLRSSLDKLESDIIEYEGRGQTRPSDETMRAILLSLVPENLEEHLELNIQRFDTYTKMRTEVVSFLEQKASKVDDGGAQPMDLDYVQGKGKGKPSNTKQLCYYCNKPGHLARDCRLKQSESSNAQKGSKGKSKSSKGSPKGSSKGTSKGKGKMGAKSSKGTSKGKTGKNHAAEGEEPEAEGQEEWNDDWPEDQQWSTEDGKWEDAGEQGALCVSSAASARAAMEAQPPQQRPFSKKELELLKTQKDFVMGKIWKRPSSFWTMPFKWVCNKSAYDGLFYCGYQRCKHKGFETPGSYKQHLWSKKDSDGHPTQAQLDAYEEETYVPPKGYKPYGLWNPETNEVATTSMSANEITEEMFEQQKRRMLASVRSTPKKKRKEPTSEEEGSAESVHSSLTVDLSLHLRMRVKKKKPKLRTFPLRKKKTWRS